MKRLMVTAVLVLSIFSAASSTNALGQNVGQEEGRPECTAQIAGARYYNTDWGMWYMCWKGPYEVDYDWQPA